MLTDSECAALGSMEIGQYRHHVIALFRDGDATAAQWDAMANAVCLISLEKQACLVEAIDRAVLTLLGVEVSHE